MLDDKVCRNCGATGKFSSPISVLLIFATNLDRPYPLIPDGEYRVCESCDAIHTLIDKATEAHPVTREAGAWSKAIVMLDSGRGREVEPKRRQTVGQC